MRFQEKYVKFFYVFLFIAFLIFINQTNLKTSLRNTVFQSSKQFFETLHLFFFHFSGGIHKLGESVDVYKERDRFKREASELKRETVRLKELELENKRLRSLLAMVDAKEGEKGQVARIIGRDILAVSDVVTINRGKEQSVDVATILVNADGLVGHVVSAGKTHAKCLLVTDLKARVCAMVQETREAGIIEGTETSLLKLKHLGINATVKIGDTIVTSGFGDLFPKGIPIGVVEMIGVESDNLYMYALVKPFVNFSKLEEVICLSSESN